MNKLTRLALGLAVALSTSGLYAEGTYLGLSLGLQFDLASLGGTITKDGLDSGRPYANPTTSACETPFCANTPGMQKAIVPENTLISLNRFTAGLISTETSGPMTGLDIGVHLEFEGDGTFWRIGVSHVSKVLGGYTSASVLDNSPLEYIWYQIEWDYYAWHVPFYWGLKAGVGESGSVYAGIGLNYSQGGWSLGGFNNGDALNSIPGVTLNQGATTTNGQSLLPIAGSRPVFAESVKFRTASISPNFVIGVEHKLSSGDKLFIEFETIVGGGLAVAGTKSQGGALAISPFPSYPINLSGTHYKFGYKMAL